MEIISNLSLIESTPWLQQIAALLTIIAIPYAILRFVIYKAKLKTSFKENETYHEVKVIDHYNQPQSLWLHLMVRNKGFELAKKTQAYLSQVWIKDKTYKKLDDFRSPVKLKWSHEADMSTIDILPRHSRRLDICYICEGDNILYLVTTEHPSGTIQRRLNPGKYVFDIVVVSDNSFRPSRFLFHVNWGGKWKTIKGDSYVRSFRYVKNPARSFTLYH
ncbi:MAG: hypothetical protein Q7S49_01050 [bacterium]|nr:hypothetical protein [bacterium]